MKNRIIRVGVTMVAAAALLLPAEASGGIFQWIRIGAFQMPLNDSGQWGEVASVKGIDYRVLNGKSTRGWWGMRYAALDNYDAFWPFEASSPNVGKEYMFAGSFYGSGSEAIDQWAVGDLDPAVTTVISYWRNEPPIVIKDGLQTSDPFPFPGTEQLVEPDSVPGTADAVFLATARNQMGLEIDHRVIAYSQPEYDDFLIWETDIRNTGNIDRDDTIEVDTPLEGLYLWRGPSFQGNWWLEWDGMKVGDSLRVWYWYHASGQSYPSTAYIDPGGFTWAGYRPPVLDYLTYAYVWGEVTLFAEGVDADSIPNNTDDWYQPSVHYAAGPDWQPIKAYAHNFAAGFTTAEWTNIYVLASKGAADPGSGVPSSSYDGKQGALKYMWENTDIYDGVIQPFYDTNAGLYHETPTAWREDMNGPSDCGWTAASWCLQPHTSYGPYNVAVGDTVHLVIAWVGGALTEETARHFGTIYKRGHEAPGTNEGQGLDANTELDWANMRVPPYGIRNPKIYEDKEGVLDLNVQRKDQVGYSAVDTLLRNASLAKYAYEHDYVVPVAPPPPDVEVSSLPGGIEIRWGSEVRGGRVGNISEDEGDFAGYRIYRTMMHEDSVYTVLEDYADGEWGTERIHLDTDVSPGQSYYYYVTAYDNDGLESGEFINRTSLGATALDHPKASLDSVRVVPNPFNLTAAHQDLYFGSGDDLNKIIFTNLPALCNIRIYSESGDLIKEIEHLDRSGTATWGVLPNEYGATLSGQLVVSGVYIAYIEELEAAVGDEANAKPTGESTFVKFIVVR